MRFVAYLCAMVESDVNSPISPNRPDTGMVRILVYYSCISLRDRGHTRAMPYLYNEQTMAGRAKKEAAPDTKAAITKGQATGKAPAPKDDLKKCKELYEVVQTRGCKGATLSTVEECVDYVAEYMNFCARNPFITYEVLKGGNAAGQKVPIEKKRAPSLGGFCLFIGWTLQAFKKTGARLEKLADDGNEDAANLLTGYALIAELIATDMDESALAGVVDANYMAKLRGLRDLKDVTSNGKEAGTKAMQVNVLSEDAIKNLQKLGGI